MLRKIIAGVLLGFFLVSTNAFAYSPKDQILLRAEMGTYSSLAGQIDSVIPKLSTEKLMELDERFGDMIYAAPGEKGALMSYVGIAIQMELEMRQEVATTPVVIYDPLTLEEQEKVEEEILELQSMMQESMEGMTESITSAMNRLYNYEDTGDFEMKLNIQAENFMNLNGEMSLSDYVSKNAMFDSEFTGKLKALINGESFGEDFEMNIAGDIDLIMKDSEIYLKIEGLNVESDEEALLMISPYVEALQNLAQDNTYISFGEDRSIAEITDIITAFDFQSVESSLITAMEKPFMQSYGKDENGLYLLEPTKHFCDTMKNQMQIFDPFGGKNCTQDQYEEMIEDFRSSDSSMMLDTSSSTTSKIVVSMDEGDIEGTIEFAWNNKSLESIAVQLLNPDNNEDTFTLAYIPKEKLDMSFNAEGVKVIANHKINRNGSITEGLYEMSVKDWYTDEEVFSMNGTYKNSQLQLTGYGENNGTSVECSVNGTLTMEVGDIEMNCNIESPDLSYVIPDTESARINMGLEYDVRNTNNNISFVIDANAGEAYSFDFSVSNEATRRSLNNWEATAPEKTKEWSDIEEEINEELYGDLYDDDFIYDFEDESYDDDENYTYEDNGSYYYSGEYYELYYSSEDDTYTYYYDDGYEYYDSETGEYIYVEYDENNPKK